MNQENNTLNTTSMVTQGQFTVAGTPISNYYPDVDDVNERWAQRSADLNSQDVWVVRLNITPDMKHVRESYLACYPAETRKQYDCRTCLGLLTQLIPIVTVDRQTGKVESLYYTPEIFEAGTPMHAFANVVMDTVNAVVTGKSYWLGEKPETALFLDLEVRDKELDYKSFYDHTFHHFSIGRGAEALKRILFHRDTKAKFLNKRFHEYALSVLKKFNTKYSDEVLKTAIAALAKTFGETDSWLKSLLDYNAIRTKLAANKTAPNQWHAVFCLTSEDLNCLQTINNWVLSKLLDDIANGVDTLTALETFAKRTNPAVYGKKIADAGNQLLLEAAKVFQEDGVLGAFKRRALSFAEIPAEFFLWKNKSELVESKKPVVADDNPFAAMVKELAPAQEEDVITFNVPKPVTMTQFLTLVAEGDRVFLNLSTHTNGLPFGFFLTPTVSGGIVHTYDTPEQRNELMSATPCSVHPHDATKVQYLPANLLFKEKNFLTEIRALAKSPANLNEEGLGSEEEPVVFAMFVVGATLDCIGDGKPAQTNAAVDMLRLLPKYRPYARAIDQYTRTYGSINPEPDNDGVMFAAGRSLMLHPQITWFIQKDGKLQAYRVGVWA